MFYSYVVYYLDFDFSIMKKNYSDFFVSYQYSPFFLFITDKPVCVEDQNIYGVSEGETAHISCRVDAYPEADTFSWSFNTSSGGMDLSRDSFTNKGSSSLLYYTPKSQMDYGTVLCVASNVVGRQIVPCIYHVIPAGDYNSGFFLVRK